MGSFGLHSGSAAYSGQGSQKVIVLVCYRFLTAQYGHCQRNGKSTARSAIVLLFSTEKKNNKKTEKGKTKKKISHVWFCPLCGRSRSGSATWEKFCLVYCYFVVSCLATSCNQGVEEIVWFDLLLVLLSTPFGFFIGILHFGEKHTQATSSTHSLYLVCSELRS